MGAATCMGFPAEHNLLAHGHGQGLAQHGIHADTADDHYAHFVKRKEALALARSVLAPGKEPYPALIDQLVAHVHAPLGRVGSLRWRAARTVLSYGYPQVTDTLIDAEVQRRKAAIAAHKANVLKAATEARDIAAEFVSNYRAQHGTGPTWNELRRHLGWRQAETPMAINHLAKQGVLTFTTANRSLDLGPAAKKPQPI